MPSPADLSRTALLSVRPPQAALSRGRLYVAVKAYSSGCSGGGVCRPAVHVSGWKLLGRAAAGDAAAAAAPATLAPRALGGGGGGGGALIEGGAQDSAALAFPALAVPPSGRPIVAFTVASASAPPGAAAVRLSPSAEPGGGSSASAPRALRGGVGAVEAARWGGGAAADVVGNRVYFALPVAAGAAGGAWIAVIDDAAAALA